METHNTNNRNGRWRKSSLSGDKRNCVEVTVQGWRKSTFSSSGDCVEGSVPV